MKNDENKFSATLMDGFCTMSVFYSIDRAVFTIDFRRLFDRNTRKLGDVYFFVLFVNNNNDTVTTIGRQLLGFYIDIYLSLLLLFYFFFRTTGLTRGNEACITICVMGISPDKCTHKVTVQNYWARKLFFRVWL